MFSEEVVDYLNYRKAATINQIKEETGVDIKFYQDRKNRSLERKEHVAVSKFFELLFILLAYFLKAIFN